MQTIAAHGACVYQALFSPHTPFILASCSTDGTLKIFDLRQATTVPVPVPSIPPRVPSQDQLTRPVMVIPAHPAEVLSLDWNKYRPWVLASGSVDKSIKIWDCRNVKLGSMDTTGLGAVCELNLQGHEYAVRKVQWSPHRADVLASASYDMSCRMYVSCHFLFIIYWSISINSGHFFFGHYPIINLDGRQRRMHTCRLSVPYTIRTLNLLLAVPGVCTTKECSRRVVGIIQ